MNQIIKYIFADSRGKVEGGQSTFDHVLDYRYIYPSFKQVYGVDLEHDAVTWWEYQTMLEGCFSADCLISKIVDIRTKDLPKKNPKARQSLLDAKAKYRLRNDDSNGLGAMFGAMKGAR